jgi:uncharacterized protein YndB with AHSA1/START domain
MTDAARPASSDDFGTRIDAHTIRFERDLPGPIERVWSYLTDPERKATWLGPGEIPSEAGAEFTWTWPGEGDEPGGHLHGRTRVYEPPHILEVQWIEMTFSGGPIRDSFVRFELAERGDRVRLTLTHRALPSNAFATFGAGWHAQLETLAALLTESDGPDVGALYEAILPWYEDFGALDDDTIRIRRLLPGPVERVWSYLTEGPLLTTWLAEDGAVPPRVGESFVLTMGGGDDMPEREGYEAKTYGTVLTYDPPRVLEYTWGVKSPDGAMLNSTVRFELEPRGDRVALTLTHAPVMPGFEARTLSGWHALLDALRARLEGVAPDDPVAAMRALLPQYESRLAASRTSSDDGGA